MHRVRQGLSEISLSLASATECEGRSPSHFYSSVDRDEFCDRVNGGSDLSSPLLRGGDITLIRRLGALGIMSRTAGARTHDFRPLGRFFYA